MSISAISAALRATTTPNGEQLATTRIVTLHALATFTNEETHECYPSIETLMRHTGLSRNAIRAAFKDLESYGWLTRRHRTARTTVYRINIDAITDANRRERKPRDYDAVEAPQSRENNREGTITQPVQENPAEAPSEPVQGELLPAPAPKKARKPRKSTVEIPGLEEDFIDFYMAYPRHEKKASARRAYEKARTKASAQEILDGARRYAAVCEAAGVEFKHRAHPSTWLNGARWEDGATPEDTVSTGPTSTQAKTLRLARSLQAMQDVQAPALASTQQAPAQEARELIHNPASQVAPMEARHLTPADDPWPSVRWTRTKSGILQIA